MFDTKFRVLLVQIMGAQRETVAFVLLDGPLKRARYFPAICNCSISRSTLELHTHQVTMMLPFGVNPRAVCSETKFEVEASHPSEIDELGV